MLPSVQAAANRDGCRASTSEGNSPGSGSWLALRVLSRRNDPTASRPFSADRDGLVMAEGAAILILEEMERAKARGAHIYAEVSGVGATNDATNIVGPDERGGAMALMVAAEMLACESQTPSAR